MDTPMAVLQRAPIRIPDTPAELLGEEVPEACRRLGEEVARDLGYAVLLASIEKTEQKAARQRREMEVRIADLFMRLGIEPFTEESVKAYQEQELKRVRTWRQKWPNVLRPASAVALAFGVGMAVVGGMVGLGISEAIGSFYLRTGMFMIVGSAGAFMMSLIGFSVESEWEWQSVPINEYDQPIPEAALAMALALKRALPSATIEIESLSLGPRAGDPFLVFKVHGEKFERRYHVGVWGEPNFQAECQ